MRQGSISSAVLWMTVLSLLLFWLPVVGPFIAGFIGGRKAGTAGNAIIAVFVPAILAAVLMFLGISVLSGMPLIGALAGMGAFVMACLHIGPLLVGAILGAAT